MKIQCVNLLKKYLSSKLEYSTQYTLYPGLHKLQTITTLQSVDLGCFNLLIVKLSLSNREVFIFRYRDECEKKDLKDRELHTLLYQCRDSPGSACVFSHVQLFATPWTVPHQAPLSMEISRQAQWSRLPFPTPGDLPDPGMEPSPLDLLHWQADSLPQRHMGSPALEIAPFKILRTFGDVS